MVLRSGSRCLTGLRVLIVEDDFDFQQSLLSVVALYGALGCAVASAAEARAWLARERFDLIISDLNMPGEDGFDFIAQLRGSPDARTRGLRCAAMSAVDDAPVRRRAVAAGFDVFVSKLSHVTAIVRSLEVLAERREHG